MNFLNSLPVIIEKSGFFFVPILVIMALINFRRIWSIRRGRPFTVMVLLMLFSYMMLGNGSSRYLLIALLAAGCLTVFGAEWLIKFLNFLQIGRILSPKGWLWLTVCAAVAVCGVKTAFHERSFVARNMMEILLKADSGKTVIFSPECKTGEKLGGLASAVPEWEFHLHDNWDTTIRAVVRRQTEDRDFYFFTRIPKENSYEDFKNCFRGRYYFFPFDLVAEECEYRYRFLLLKFNGRTGDGEQTGVPVNILATQLPDPLPLKENKDTWRTADINRLAPVLLQNHALLNPANSFGTFAGQNFRFRAINGVYPEQFELQYRNALGWLLDHRTFKLKVQDQASVTAAADRPPVIWKKSLISGEVPLMLTPRQICVTGNRFELFFEGAVPGWQYNNDRMQITLSYQNGGVKVATTDRILKTRCETETKIISCDPAKLKKTPLDLLIIEDLFDTRLGLKTYLPEQLSQHSTIDTISAVAGAVNAIDPSRHPVKWPQKKYDAVLINLLGDAFARPWTVPFIVDQLAGKLNVLSKKIRQNYGDIPIGIILPPAPPGGESQFPYSESFFIARMSHYNICSAVERLHRKGKLTDSVIIPLYLTLHPEKDYVFHNHAQHTYSGYFFTASGQKKLAAATGAYLADMLKK